MWSRARNRHNESSTPFLYTLERLAPCTSSPIPTSTSNEVTQKWSHRRTWKAQDLQPSNTPDPDLSWHILPYSLWEDCGILAKVPKVSHFRLHWVKATRTTLIFSPKILSTKYKICGSSNVKKRPLATLYYHIIIRRRLDRQLTKLKSKRRKKYELTHSEWENLFLLVKKPK